VNDDQCGDIKDKHNNPQPFNFSWQGKLVLVCNSYDSGMKDMYDYL
jgi:hypothetical protein